MRIAVSRAAGAERVVTPLELFFDLVSTAAVLVAVAIADTVGEGDQAPSRSA